MSSARPAFTSAGKCFWLPLRFEEGDMKFGYVAGLALLAACTQGAEEAPQADTAPSVAQAGVYVFDSEPAAPVACIMMLDDNVVEDAPGFHSVWLGPGCESTFSTLMALSGWEEMPEDGVRLVGAEGSTFGEFTRGADGLLRGVSGNDGKTYTLLMGE
jgi:hypothetical protein